MEGTAKTRPDILKAVLGLYVQYCPCEASEQKLGQKPESELKVIELLSPFDLSLKNKHFEKKAKIGRKMTKLCPIKCSCAKVAYGLFCAN